MASDPKTWGLNAHVNFEVVTPGYFSTMGIRLVRGRLFTDQDTATSPGAILVSESAARRIWPGKDAIGQQLHEMTYVRKTAEGAPPIWQTVVGIVADVRYRGLNDVRLDMYAPATQSQNKVRHLMVRTDGDVASVVAAVRAAVREADPEGHDLGRGRDAGHRRRRERPVALPDAGVRRFREPGGAARDRRPRRRHRPRRDRAPARAGDPRRARCRQAAPEPPRPRRRGTV